MPVEAVEAEDDELNTYQDVKVQQITMNRRLDFSAFPDENGPYDWEQQNEVFQAIGENFWNQRPAGTRTVAELVAYRINQVVLMVRHDGTSTNPGTLEVVFAVSINPTQGAADIQTVNDPDYDVESPQGTIVNVSSGITSSNTEDAGRLFESIMSVSEQHKDSANSTGGGGGDHVDRTYTEMINLRDHFGRGPLFTEEDVITMRMGEWRAFDLHNNSVRAVVSGNLYWDIYEIEEPEMTDVLEGTGP